MWTLFMIALALLFAAAFLALAALFARLLPARGRIRSLALGAIPAAALIAILTLTMGMVNAIVCALNLIAIWGIVCLLLRPIRRPHARFLSAALAIAITAGYLAFGWVSAHRVQREYYLLQSPKLASPLRLAVFTDSHVGTTFSGKGLAPYLDRMQAENPDAVLIVGDFVDDDTSRDEMLDACAALGALDCPVYYVFGNHDKGYYDDARRGYGAAELVSALEAAGVTVLEDEAISLRGDVRLIGRNDLSENQRGNARAEIAELAQTGENAGAFTIVMDHQPADFDAEAAAGVDLVLCGHTHGGQMIPINHVGEWLGINDLVYGREARGSTQFIVSSGISDWALQFKTGCHSEYLIVDLQPEE